MPFLCFSSCKDLKIECNACNNIHQRSGESLLFVRITSRGSLKLGKGFKDKFLQPEPFAYLFLPLVFFFAIKSLSFTYKANSKRQIVVKNFSK